MTELHTADTAPPCADSRARRNVALLFAAQAIMGAQLVLHFVFGPLAGAMLAREAGVSAAWATTPITATVILSALSAAPASLLMSRVGRRPGFLLGAASGAAGGALAAYAIVASSFPLFLAGSALLGVYQAHQALFRFAAADTASPSFQPTAISMVLAGGLLAAPIAGALGVFSQDWLAPVPIAGVYLAVAAVNLAGALPLALLDIPKPPRRAPGGAEGGRPLAEIFASWQARAALVAGMVSYALMNLVMTSTSTAMIACGLEKDDASLVVSAHVVAMYAPTFITGAVIARIGHAATVAIGLGMLATAGVVALAGVEIENFYGALILLGLGWCFGFIGATSWIASLHRPEERGRVQAFNDMMVFGLVAIASISSGVMMNAVGWEGVNLLMLPLLTLAAAALAIAAGRRAAAP